MNEINIDGVIGWDVYASDITRKLKEMSGDVTVNINSGGGYITEGVAIMAALRSYSKGSIYTVVSYAASMATQIALVGKKVSVYDNSIFMIHNAQGFAVGDHREMAKRSEHLEKLSSMLAGIYTKKTSKSKDEITQMMDDDTYLFGEDIVANGFADETIESDSDTNMTNDIAKEMFLKAQDALKEEGLNATQLQEQVQMCENGTCTPPSQIVNSNRGNGKNSTQGQAMNLEQAKAELDTANATIKTIKAEMAGKDTELASMTEARDAAVAELATAKEATTKAEEKATLQSDVTALAFEMGVSAEVAKEMLAQPTKDKAEIVGLKAVQPSADDTDSSTTNGEDNEDGDKEDGDKEELSEETAAAIAQAIADNL